MGSINCFEPAFGGRGNTLKVSHKLIPKQRLGPRISERSDHKTTPEYRYTAMSGRRPGGLGFFVWPDEPNPGPASGVVVEEVDSRFLEGGLDPLSGVIARGVK